MNLFFHLMLLQRVILCWSRTEPSLFRIKWNYYRHCHNIFKKQV